MTGRTLRRGDGWFLLAVAAAWLLLWPDGGAWIQQSLPIGSEASRAAVDLEHPRLYEALGLPVFEPWMRAVCTLLLAALIALCGALAARAFQTRLAAFAIPVFLLTHPAVLASRLDPALGTYLIILLPVIFTIWALLTPGLKTRLVVASGPLICAVIGFTGWNLIAHGWSPEALKMVAAPSATMLPEGFDPLLHGLNSLLPVLILVVLSSRAKWTRRQVLLAGAALGCTIALVPATDPDPLASNLVLLLPATLAMGLFLSSCVARASGDVFTRVLLAACGGVIVLSGLGSHKRVELAQQPWRQEASRFVEAMLALPRHDVPCTEIVLGLGTSGAAGALARAGSLLPGLEIISTPRLVDPGAGHALRLLEWKPPTPLQTEDRAAYDLVPHFMALRADPKHLALVGPADGSAVPCKSATDEPVFRWSVPADRDPGPKAFTFVAVRTSPGRPAGGSMLERLLDQTVLARSVEGHRVTWSWRPSLRSQASEERELLWEYEDIAPRDSEFTWTIIAHGSTGPVLMAVPFALNVGR